MSDEKTKTKSRRVLSLAIGAGGLLAAAFVVIVVGFLVMQLTDVGGDEPLDAPQLDEVRAQVEATGTADVREAYRAMDQRIRQEHFARQEFRRRGTIVAVVGAALVLLLGHLWVTLNARRKSPGPDAQELPGGLWMRLGVGAAAVVLGIAAAVWAVGAIGAGDVTDRATIMAMLEDLESKASAAPVIKQVKNVQTTQKVAATQDNTSTQEGVAKTSDSSTKTAVAAADVKWPDDFQKNWPFWRGFGGSGISPHKDIPLEFDEKTGKNILWKTKVPLAGLSSPVVWGDKVFLSGGSKEKREVYCFSVDTGKLLWTGTYKSDPKAPKDYPYYQQMEKQMHAAPTCAVDGKRVYAHFANGEVAAFDINTGKNVWAKLIADPEGNMYGISASLLVHKDKVLVQFDGGEYTLSAYDSATGKQLWKKDRPDATWASPILAQVKDKEFQVVVSGAPSVSGWDPENGKMIWECEILEGDVAPSPIFAGGYVIAMMADSGIHAIPVDKKDTVETKWTNWGDDFEYASIPDTLSPVSDGKFVYVFATDSLLCFDMKDGSLLYEKEMPGSASYASPAVVGDKLVTFAGKKVIVVQTGKDFKVIRTNELDEYIDASPAFAPGKMFLRGGTHLYCIGEKK
ncbi:MAG: PQQ-binding-like beta-propeller repeat protein [Phycisphaerae bacterium]